MRTRLILGVLIAIGIVILVIILIINALVGPSQPAPKPLINYANTSTTMQLLIDGPVQANQTHQSVEITVGSDQNQVQIFKGYNFESQTNKTFVSNSSAYATFLRSIDFAGYTRGNTNPNLADYRGYCPLGERYVFQVVDGGGNTTQSLWTTTCGGGTFKGNTYLILQLFQNQIPNYFTITQNVPFSH